MLSFGQRLKMIRKEAGITQAELAEKLMVSVQAISKWECDNTMPDIGQIVPLAAILGVTTDCLLGVGTDQKADEEKLYKAIGDASQNCFDYSYENNFDYKCYELYRDFLKKYPLDYAKKLTCACYLNSFLEKGKRFYKIPKEEEDSLYDEALAYLASVINYDRDTTRLIDAKKVLINMYLLKNDFAKAEAVAGELPQIGNVRNYSLLEICDGKGDIDKCVTISNRICRNAVNEYMNALWTRARRISVYGNAKKLEAIGAWRDYEAAAKLNHKVFNTLGTVCWVFSSLNMLSNDYIAISEIDKAFEVIEELTDLMISYYNESKEKGYEDGVNYIKEHTWFRMHWCYNRCFETEDNIIANDPRFKKCEERLAALD